jgi:hypothetical protein
LCRFRSFSTSSPGDSTGLPLDRNGGQRALHFLLEHAQENNFHTLKEHLDDSKDINPHIETEHLLLGLLREDTAIIAEHVASSS